VFPGDSGCTVGDELRQLGLDYGTFPDDMLYAVLSVRREGEDAGFFTMPLRDRPLNDNFPMPTVVGSTICGPQPPAIEVGETYCVTITAHDIAGNPAGGTAEACATAKACEPTQYLRAQCIEVESSSGGCSAAAGRETSGATTLLLLLALALASCRRSSRGQVARRRART